MSEKTESNQQSAALFIVAGVFAIALIGLHVSGAISDPTMTALVWFVGVFVVASCLLKAALPLLSNKRH